MNDCCITVDESGGSCPRCGVTCSVVGTAPVLPHHPTAATGPWRYCANLACAVVFFLGADVVDDREVVAQVGHKALSKPVPVCFCFAHTLGDLRADVAAHDGVSTIKASVKAAVAEGLCACEHLNPSGDCCLTAVHRAVKDARQLIEEGAARG